LIEKRVWINKKLIRYGLGKMRNRKRDQQSRWNDPVMRSWYYCWKKLFKRI